VSDYYLIAVKVEKCLCNICENRMILGSAACSVHEQYLDLKHLPPLIISMQIIRLSGIQWKDSC